MSAPAYRVTWSTAAGELVAEEPTPDELEASIPALLAGYNEPTNAVLLGHTAALTADDVRHHYGSLSGGRGHAFLLYRGGTFVGDADLRGISGQMCEFAFLIADPHAQGQGLGTTFAQMIHALAFGPLGMGRTYAAVLPDNTASQRVFAKLGYEVDNTAVGLAYGDPGDIILMLDRPAFLQRNASAVAGVRIGVR